MKEWNKHNKVMFIDDFNWSRVKDRNLKKSEDADESFQCKYLDKIDFLICFVIYILTIFTRFYNIYEPNTIVFDEYFFLNFTNNYLTKSYYFDIHPPFGKLVLYYTSRILGYNKATKCDRSIDYYEGRDYVKPRCSNAFWSSLCSIYIYIILRNMNSYRTTSVTVSLLIVFEDSMIIEGKFVLTDGILHSFSTLALMMISFLFKYDYNDHKWKYIFICSCIASSVASSIKQIAYPGIILTLICTFYKLYASNYRDISNIYINIFLHTIVLFFIFIFLFISFYVLHLSLLERNNNESLIKTLKNNIKLIYANTLEYDDEIQREVYSLWYQWPLLTTNFIRYFKSNNGRYIYLHYNIFNLYLGFFSVLISLFILYYYLKNKKVSSKEKFRVFVFLAGYSLHYFPFAFIPRPLLLYHYIIPIIYSLLCFSNILNFLIQKNVFLGFLMALFAVSMSFYNYIYYFPIIYSTDFNQTEKYFYDDNIWFLYR